jgi:hypothetical protein
MAADFHPLLLPTHLWKLSRFIWGENLSYLWGGYFSKISLTALPKRRVFLSGLELTSSVEAPWKTSFF